MTKKELGKFGEDKACEYLIACGYKVIDRNFSCRLGELDIVARRGDTLSFVEVKTRTGYMYGTPAEAVDSKKISHIRRVAEIYIRQRNIHPLRISFDVLEVSINHIKGAF